VCSSDLIKIDGTKRQSGWLRYRNLQRRPHAPNKGRGRLQRQIARAFHVHGPTVSASEIYHRWARRWQRCHDGRPINQAESAWSAKMTAFLAAVWLQNDWRGVRSLTGASRGAARSNRNRRHTPAVLRALVAAGVPASKPTERGRIKLCCSGN